MKIFINPGHAPDNADPGACGNGLKENEVARKIGLKVSNNLREVGIEVVCEQIDGLQKICNAANNFGADLFVSIHCNSAENTSARGIETFHFAGSVEGNKLATAIQNRLVAAIPTLNRGVKTANYAVLRGTDMPGVLVETAFISNSGDAKLLVEKETDFARAISAGILDYVGVKVPAPDIVDAPRETRFNKIEDIPDWAKGTIQKMLDKKILNGGENAALDLSTDMLRIFVTNDRAGLY